MQTFKVHKIPNQLYSDQDFHLWDKHYNHAKYEHSLSRTKKFETTASILKQDPNTFHVFGACQEPTKECMPLNFSFSMLLCPRNFVQPQSGMH